MTRILVPESCRQVVPVEKIAEIQEFEEYKIKNGEVRKRARYTVIVGVDGKTATLTDTKNAEYIAMQEKKLEAKKLKRADAVKKKNDKISGIRSTYEKRISDIRTKKDTQIEILREKLNAMGTVKSQVRKQQQLEKLKIAKEKTEAKIKELSGVAEKKEKEISELNSEKPAEKDKPDKKEKKKPAEKDNPKDEKK